MTRYSYWVEADDFGSLSAQSSEVYFRFIESGFLIDA